MRVKTRPRVEGVYFPPVGSIGSVVERGAGIVVLEFPGEFEVMQPTEDPESRYSVPLRRLYLIAEVEAESAQPMNGVVDVETTD